MEDEDPKLVAWVKIGQKQVEGEVEVNLDACRLEVLRRDLEAVARRLDQQRWYVRDAYLGGPSGPVADGLYRVYSFAWDWTAGWLVGRGRGRRCEEYVDETRADVLRGSAGASTATGQGWRTMAINEASYFDDGVIDRIRPGLPDQPHAVQADHPGSPGVWDRLLGVPPGQDRECGRDDALDPIRLDLDLAPAWGRG